MQASQSLGLSHSQDPSMEDHIVQLDAPVLEIEALDHGLQGEVIIFTSQLRVSYFQICLTVC